MKIIFDKNQIVKAVVEMVDTDYPTYEEVAMALQKLNNILMALDITPFKDTYEQD